MKAHELLKAFANCKDESIKNQFANISEFVGLSAIYGEDGQVYANNIIGDAFVFYVYPDLQPDLVSAILAENKNPYNTIGVDCAGQVLCLIEIEK